MNERVNLIMIFRILTSEKFWINKIMSQSTRRNKKKIIIPFTTEEDLNLISLVQARPCIYDKAKKNYKNTDIRDNNFTAIAKEMNRTSTIYLFY